MTSTLGRSAGLLALALGLCASASAHAATINGGGSDLLAPAWQQAVYCYDNDAANQKFYVKGTPVTQTTPIASPGVTCSPTTGTLIQYDSTGSGAGQAGVFAHTGIIKDAAGNILFGSTDAAGTVKLFSTLQYGLSDNSLVNSDLAVYNVGTSTAGGTTRTYSYSYNRNTGSTVTATTYQGVTFDPSMPVSATNFNPAFYQYGALIQFPVSVDPIALAYNPTYVTGGVTKSFTINTSDSKLHLDQTAYCRIFNGDITNWNDSTLTALNGGTSLTGGVSVPITRIGRSDGAGDTSILTRHLASTACTTSGRLVTADKYTAGTTTLPASAQSLFTLVSGAGAVAYKLGNTSASIGYIGPSYVLPASNNTGIGSTAINAASLLQTTGSKYLQPNATNALAAFGTINPPQSTVTGLYNASDTNSDRRDPTQWVQSTAATAALANPTASGAYPIVGTTNFLGYTCYASSASVNAISGFLAFLPQTNVGALAPIILSNAGLAQLPQKWQNAITRTFFYSTATGNASSLNLFIDYKGHTGTGSNPNCAPSTVVGA